MTPTGELYFGDRPPPSLSALSGGFGVVTVGTFSKILATGLRIGWIHGEPSIVELFGKMRFAMGLNQLIVRVVADYMEEGRLDRCMLGCVLRGLYQTKMETLADALEHHAGEFIDFSRPIGGFYLWVDVAKRGLRADAMSGAPRTRKASPSRQALISSRHARTRKANGVA
ncbi:MAG: aminotransferase class I/II-fold pyridoxal phosphate-dependent enzyme [Gammaproteobacteria bacterium]|nr:aminotransferase class I/II-fold pyridoxal phosphate-dependent enzyme [Gammaproteobacteria bacterium]